MIWLKDFCSENLPPVYETKFLPCYHADKTANGQGENAGYQYPLTNFYDSRDGDLQKYHAALMKIAGINAEARERIKTSFTWLKDNWFNRSGYVKYNNRSVVMLFISGTFNTLAEWESIAREAGVNPVPYFVCQYNALPDFQAAFNWMPVSDRHLILRWT